MAKLRPPAVLNNPTLSQQLIPAMMNPRPNREVVCAKALHLLITRYGRSEETARMVLGLRTNSGN